MDITNLLTKVYTGTLPPVFKNLDIKAEINDLQTVENLISEFPKLMDNDKNFKLVFRVLSYLEKLDSYLKWMEHPIYLNEFKDKYGNIYIQGRTSIKGQDGKTKWISAYIGGINDYPKGIKDSDALNKAKPLIRKKLKKYYDI